MWGKIIIPMYRLWLHGLYGLYGPRCPLSPKRPINLISLSLSAIAVMLAVSCYYLFRKSVGYVYEFGSTKYLVKLKSYLRGKDYFVLQRYSVTGNGCLWGKVPGIWIWIQMWLKFEQTSFSCVITFNLYDRNLPVCQIRGLSVIMEVKWLKQNGNWLDLRGFTTSWAGFYPSFADNIPVNEGLIGSMALTHPNSNGPSGLRFRLNEVMSARSEASLSSWRWSDSNKMEID